jgi:O-antigen/teichoic acid export membrane protein
MLKQAWPFGLVLVLWTVYFWVDSVMLSVMKGDEEVGLYNAAYRILVVLQLIPGAYWGAVFPLMSRLYMSSKASLLVILHKSLKYMLILALPIALGTTLLADRFVIQIFGADYEAAALGLQILTWTIVFQFLSASYVHLFNSVNRQMVVAFYLVFTLLANVVLNAVLIPKYGLVGASIATVVTGAMNLACAFVVSRRLGYAIPLKGLAIAAAKVVTASAAMGAFVKYFDSLHLLALVPAAAAVYFAVVLGLGAIDSEDTAMLRSALTGK